jgi:hypothetical protein
MRQYNSRESTGDPFKLDSAHAIERAILEHAGLVDESGTLPPPKGSNEMKLSVIGRTKAQRQASRQAAFTRLIMAAFGSLSLLIPMIIMVLVPTRNACLITTSISVTLFAAAIGVGSELKPGELIAAASAYTAVLVVFVGASLAAPNGHA